MSSGVNGVQYVSGMVYRGVYTEGYTRVRTPARSTQLRLRLGQAQAQAQVRSGSGPVRLRSGQVSLSSVRSGSARSDQSRTARSDQSRTARSD